MAKRDENGSALCQKRSKLTKKGRNEPKGVKFFCKWIDVKSLNWKKMMRKVKNAYQKLCKK